MAKSKKPAGANGESGGDDGYEVGYCKPPKTGQFKKGQSGNPGGRKKGSQNISATLKEVLDQEVEITESQKKQRATLEKALMLRWVQEGLKGNVRAIEGIYDRKQRIELASDASEQDHDASDDALLENYVQAKIDAALAKFKREWANRAAQPKTESDEDV
ncbi:DUF5681 domain-containing protein [Chenggangzhangella methanolivorans]|uniref:DUF5681 domain-containing protein n=1 Tax=Chenggangzhangella methanolivorans TaxID=1437009 RepID=A0A9E6RAM7_9HYPH|nr:DUF5681 domain-containing protein [Chenggangzhangella methanolivorans]QZO01256.1 DUF5681 domain-containing protein [Chenggangzhangella methanolivorans]